MAYLPWEVCHAAANDSFAPEHLSTADSLEQGGGKGRSVSCVQAFAGSSAEFARAQQRGVGGDSASPTLQGFRVAGTLSDAWDRRFAGRTALRKAAAVEERATATVAGHSGQRSGGLWFGHRNLDLAHDRLGDRAGVRGALPSRPRAQTAA